MKIGLVTDLHFGARNDATAFDAHFRKFYSETFFPHLAKLGIKTILCLGDTFDRRKFINFNTLRNCREYFFDAASDAGIEVHMLVGNHDTYFKNTNEVNSPRLLLGDYDNIVLHESVSEIIIGDSKILFVPWICADNHDESIKKIKESRADLCVGHFEFGGYQMYRDSTNPHGMDASLYTHFPLVISGHFHHRHSKGNITYMGNPYEITWSDFDDPRGFAIYDCHTNQLEYVDNPVKIFHKIYYDDSESPSGTTHKNIDVDTLKNCCIKLIVVEKNNIFEFDNFVEKLYDQDLIDLKIIESYAAFEEDAINDTAALEDTMTVLKEYVDSIDANIDKDRLKSELQALYVEAQGIL